MIYVYTLEISFNVYSLLLPLYYNKLFFIACFLGLISSEKYMNIDSGRSSKKHRRIKRKKKSKKLKAPTESDEDVPPLHIVNIIEGEMPEGARTSAEDDDRNMDDPHRALNIDLDE